MSATQNLVSLRITENIATGKDDTKDLVAAINNGWDRLHFFQTEGTVQLQRCTDDI